MTTTTSTAGDKIYVTFTGTAGEIVGLGFSSVTIGTSNCCGSLASIYNPDGSLLRQNYIGRDGSGLNLTLPASGSYLILLDPGINTGSATLTLSDDLTATASIGGPSSTILLPRAGQNDRITFTGTAGEIVGVGFSSVTIGTSNCCGSLVSIYKPDGSLFRQNYVGRDGVTINLPTLPTSGSYLIFLDPGINTGSATMSLTHVGAFQPVTQAYGTWNGVGVHGLAPSAQTADPVNSLTGAFTEAETDLTVAAPGVSFAFGRSYTSADATAGRLGPGWTDSYSASLGVQANGDVILHGEDGQRLTYAKQANGSFVGGRGASSTLTAISGGYQLLRHDQVAYRFDTAGVLQSELDRNGQGLTLAYDGSGHLTTITDSIGQAATLAYNGGGLLSSVSTADGRTVSYGYTSGHLSSVTLPDPDDAGPLTAPVTTYGYDGAGRLAAEVDPNNHTVVTNVYDPASGRVSQQTDANNKTTTFAWDPATQTATITDARAHVWKDIYQNNVLIKQIDPVGEATQLAHDTNLDTTAVIAPNGTDTTNMTYDSRGNLLTTTAPISLGANVKKTYTYDAQNNVLTATDARGTVSQYGYDASGNTTSITQGGQQIAGATYGSQGHMLTSTDGNGNETTYSYDAEGNVASVTSPDPDGVGPLAASKTTFTYDAMGDVLTRVDALGNCSGCTPADHRATYSYDANGHLLTETAPLGHTTTYTYDADGNRTSVTDAKGNTTSNVYDNASNLVEVIGADPDGVGPLESPVTRYSYDDAGNRVSMIDPLGNCAGCNGLAHTTLYAFNQNNQLASTTTPLGEKTTYTYDANGNLGSTVDPRGNCAGCTAQNHTTAYAYDAAGRPLRTIDPLGNCAGCNAAAHTATTTYDSVGNLGSATDANGHQTSYTYDSQGRLLTLTAPDGGITTYTYDLAGNVLTRTDENQHTTSYDYNDAEQLQSVTGPDPDGNGPAAAPVTSYTYDADGHQLTKTDPNGNATQASGDGVTTNSYDAAARITGISYSDSTPDVSFSYDPVGNRTQMTDGAGTIEYQRDNLNRLTSVARGTSSFSYAYDINSNLLSRAYPDGSQTTYTYDADNHMATASTGGKTTSYGYDSAGDLVTTTLPASNGYSETDIYDNAGRLIEVKNANATATLSDFLATLDPVGNPTEIDQSGAVSLTSTYSYDANNRLTGVCYQAGSCPNGSDPYIRWAYDKAGNRLSETRPGGTTSYTYDNADELIQAGAVNYGYDANGNETSAGSRAFTYDLANRVSTTTALGTTTSYSYDGDGNRLEASTGTGGSQRTDYLWDVNNPLAEIAREQDGNANLIRRFEYGNSRISMTTPTDTFYFHYDASEDVSNVTSSNGTPEWSYTYEPFGGTRTATQQDPNAPANPIGFAQSYLDQTGLYLLRDREYDPTTGRFTQVDPLPAFGGAYTSTYVYANNRPSVLYDPSGDGPIPIARAYQDATLEAVTPDTDAQRALASAAGGAPPPPRDRVYAIGYRGTEKYGTSVLGREIIIGKVQLEDALALDGRRYNLIGYATPFDGPPIRFVYLSYACLPACGAGEHLANDAGVWDFRGGRFETNGDFTIATMIAFTGFGVKGLRVYKVKSLKLGKVPLPLIFRVSCRARIRARCYITWPKG
ncbi:MAG: DUF6531 domain-containing protein [Gaiellaceae bacterium]